MKKLALLLGSLLVVTATQAKEVVVAPVEAEKEVVVVAEPVVEEVAVVEEYAAPTLKLTGLKTGLWHENRSGQRNGNYGSNSLRLYLDFAYGEDWTFNVATRRYFSSNTKDSYGVNEGLFNQGENRVYLGATRKINDQYSVGYTYVNRHNWDAHDLAFNFAPTDYLSGYFTYEYQTRANRGVNIEDTDVHYIEFQPKLSWNGWGISYYYEGEFGIENDYEYQYQQVRLFTPAWTYGNFSVSGEYRGTITYDSKDYLGKDVYGIGASVKDAFDVNRIYALTKYQLTETTNLFANIGYEMGTWKEANNGSKDSDMFILETGVSIKF